MRELLDEYDALHSELQKAQGMSTVGFGQPKRASYSEIQEIYARLVRKRQEILNYATS